ncbi:hypothetical protein [Kitasatospora fiedleri]|uniref:hypothetical protein n=1 Tax=Kitasatospora fiedleri TaxID=2991545 RepID=UPI002499E340|nr:hypothetical protein [Kitasatospora fiedleri]
MSGRPPHPSRRALLLGGTALAALGTGALAWELWPHGAPAGTAFRPGLDGEGLLTNEYAFHNEQAPDARTSPDWVATSGSLFAHGGTGSTGEPDGDSPGPDSARHTGSAVFRLVTRRRDFADCRVTAEVCLQPPVTTARTPAQDWDGAHLWLRYHSPQELYALSFRRRDGHVEIKRKTPGPDGDDGDGDYRTLAEGRHALGYGQWHTVSGTVRDTAGGKVHLALAVDGRTVLEAVDPDPGRLSGPGGAGLRADNTALEFRGFAVDPV